MQHLLDFIQEHTLDERLYFRAQCPEGALELLWRRSQYADHWHVRPSHREGPWELVPRRELISDLEARDADMVGVKRELQSLLAEQIAVADKLLRDADQQRGRDFVDDHPSFIRDLQAAIEMLTTPPNMDLVHGGGERTTLRTGHLSIVRD
ncbi:MAG TPA: hypothetical protein VJV78_33380 [Polyangiales bacterium]|nr:hypothetical protein [Polyangiales bacterium]